MNKKLFNIFCQQCCFASVEPEKSASEDIVNVAKETDGIIVADFELPFIVDKEENTPIVSVQLVPHKLHGASVVELVDFIVSNVDNESETCVLSCTLSIDTDELYRMKELSLIQIDVKTKDGFKSHKHHVKLELGNNVTADILLCYFATVTLQAILDDVISL